ncbi:MAG TPA: hypothetical protein PLT39_03750, partial [Thermotogota bacterium]|nr:hypothetical protein [Thermotogota bacterium]
MVSQDTYRRHANLKVGAPRKRAALKFALPRPGVHRKEKATKNGDKGYVSVLMNKTPGDTDSHMGS